MKTTPVRYTLFLLSLLMLFSCKSAKLSDAEERQRIGEYYEAAAIYRRVYTKTPAKNRDLRGYVAYRMAECNRMISNTARATSAYMNAVRYNYPDSIVYLRLAQSLHKEGKYGEATRYYEDFLSWSPGHQLAENGLKGCQLALEWKATPTLYEVRREEKFNSRKGEFAPMLHGEKSEELYFSSSRTKDKEATVNDITGLVNNNLFVVKQDEQGQWLPPEELIDPVNTDFDEGTPSFTKDGNTMYYTYCAHDPEGDRIAEIYSSSRSGAAWSAGTRVPIVNDSITSLGHPSISPDGLYLYFVTDGMGSYGGKDIYRSRLIGTEFGPMENLGPQINTPGDEMFPYMRDSVTLYFASNGHPGMGGLDLFKAVQDSTGNWSVTNMGAPINSQADDFGITFYGDKQEKGFFSSNRTDARGYDHIYSFEYPTFTIFIEGFVVDIDDELVDSAMVHVVGKDGMNTRVSVRNDGSYRMELKRDESYVMMASAPGFLNQNFELKTTPEEQSETYYVDFFLSPIDVPVVVENIFYDFDKATLRPESKEALNELIKIMTDNPNVTIELGAHTDRKGTEQYNEGLAQRRAQAVVDYLIEAGIAADRMEAKGYGESVPKTVTRKMAETHDFLNEGDILTEEFVLRLSPQQQEIADQINRRTEFQVLRTNYNLF
ncbi:OmpA family protein [Parabacteroides sp. OttesenSCG-928-N08]|nr:OmpA family protein [Parabacteroides sp. OttesenSCG-928-N08]